MATNKNQHFVPRCYLRAFTKNEANATINLFNLDRKKLIQDVPVKHQCSGSYFYGQDDKLEEAIQASEAGYARMLREIRTPGFKLYDGAKGVLRHTWLLQHLRTEAASMRAVQMAADTNVVLGVDDPTFRLGIRDAVQVAMHAVAAPFHVIDALKVCLLRNRTVIPFTTSDDPAVATNRWHLEDRRALGASFGLRSSGLVAILPLTPDIAFIAYDGDVYNVQHTNGWTDIRSTGDVRALNEHQLLNCFANLFVHDPEQEDEIKAQLADSARRRLFPRHRINYAVLDFEGTTHVRYRVVEPSEATRKGDAILHTQTLHPRPTRWPSFLRWRMPGSVFSNGTGVGYIRAEHASTSHTSTPFRKLQAR